MLKRARHTQALSEPTAVWLVRPGSPETVRGRLSLDGGTLRFAGEDVAIDIPAADIRRARRRRGAPILEISYGVDHTLFLYFAEPPPLPGATPKLPRLGSRGLERAASVMRLREASRLLKQKIDEWSDAVREAGGR